MYSATGKDLLSIHRKMRRDRPDRMPTVPVESKYTPIPLKSQWFGSFVPETILRVKNMGTLGDDVTDTSSFLPSETLAPVSTRADIYLPDVAVAPPTIPALRAPATAQVLQDTSAPGGSIWDNLFSGIGKVVTPAAQALVGIATTGAVNRAQQQTLAATWNPSITGPALQAMAYRNAYATGMGTTAISGTTLALLGGAAVLLIALSRK